MKCDTPTGTLWPRIQQCPPLLSSEVPIALITISLAVNLMREGGLGSSPGSLEERGVWGLEGPGQEGSRKWWVLGTAFLI